MASSLFAILVLSILLWTLSLSGAERLRPLDDKLFVGNESDDKISTEGNTSAELKQSLDAAVSVDDGGVQDVESGLRASGTFSLEFPSREYAGISVNDTWCGPIVGLMDKKGYGASHHIPVGAYIMFVAGEAAFDLRKRHVSIMWADAIKAGKPYVVDFSTEKCAFTLDYQVALQTPFIIPGTLGIFELFMAGPLYCLFTLVMLFRSCVLGTQSSAETPVDEDEDEKFGWEPRIFARFRQLTDHPVVYCSLILGAFGHVFVDVYQHRHMLFYPSVVLDLLTGVAKACVSVSVATAFLTRGTQGRPQLVEGVPLPAGVTRDCRQWGLAVTLLSFPFCVAWQWQEGNRIAILASRLQGESWPTTWEMGDLFEHGAYFLVFCGILRISVSEVMFLVFAAKFHIQSVRTSIGEWKGQPDRVHAEVVWLSTEVLPGLRGTTLKIITICSSVLGWQTLRFLRWYCLRHVAYEGYKEMGLGGDKMKYMALLVPTLFAIVALTGVSEDCRCLRDDMNNQRSSCSVEDHAKLLLTEKFMQESNRGQGLGSTFCGIVVTRGLLASLALRFAVASSLLIAIVKVIMQSAAETQNAMFRWEEALQSVPGHSAEVSYL
eukprot:TRINITY_DN49201_c0_g1_i1.p1 TRINITY_DN49201_c0_g1~~TRINITY_DN49201_c0_g1_i1.p1  ORF type:complete len:605 (-),score=52.08 TRINITY_DN49201_c0_g1_i1:104-1918(-)